MIFSHLFAFTNRKTKKQKQKKVGGTQKNMCSPIVAGKTITNNTCMTPELLRKIIAEYNKHTTNTNKINSNQSDQQLWKEWTTKTCNTDNCWITHVKSKNLRDHIKNTIFVPQQPPEWAKDPDAWLTNFDIDKVLTQYQSAIKSFHFIGTTSIDFLDKQKENANMCIEPALCKFDIVKEIAQGKTQIGIVFNLDRHDEPGSHWVSVFIDLLSKTMYYFDSASPNNIPNEINEFYEKIKVQEPTMKLVTNQIAHQQEGTECGMYSLYFLTKMCQAPATKKADAFQRLFNSTRIPDKSVFAYRKKFFRG